MGRGVFVVSCVKTPSHCEDTPGAKPAGATDLGRRNSHSELRTPGLIHPPPTDPQAPPMADDDNTHQNAAPSRRPQSTTLVRHQSGPQSTDQKGQGSMGKGDGVA